MTATVKNCILITGGTGKLGSIFVTGFLQSGWHVVFISRSREKIAALIEAKRRSGFSQLSGICVDLTEAGAAEGIVDNLGSLNLRPNCLVNNARNLAYLGLEADGSPPRAHWLGQYLLDVVVPYELTQVLVRMSASELHDVINIGSMYGIVAVNPGLYEDQSKASPLHYGIAKAALVHLTREMAVRFAPHGVKVNAVSYGGVEGRVNAEFARRYGQLCPIGRMLSEEEVLGPVQFLASPQASGMTGHNLVIDGGWSIW